MPIFTQKSPKSKTTRCSGFSGFRIALLIALTGLNVACRPTFNQFSLTKPAAVPSAAPVLAPPANLSLSLSPITVSAGTVVSGSGITVQFTAINTSTAPFATGGLVITFSTSGGASTGTFGPVVDHADGTYTSTFTGILAGSATSIHATANTAAITSSAPTVSVTVGPYSLAQSVVSVAAGSVTSGSPDLLTLTAKDGAGNLISTGGLAVLFNNVGGTSTGTYCGPVTDVGNGTYTCNFTGVLAGTATSITATVGASPVTSAAPTITVTPGPFSLSQSVVSVASGSDNSGTVDTVTLTVKDTAGNQLNTGGLAVVFLNAGGSSTGTYCATVTDGGNGTYSCAFTGVTAGTATSMKTSIGGSPVTSAAPTITVGPGVASLSQSIVSRAAATVNSGSTDLVTLTTKDAAGNLITSGGLTVTFGNSTGTSTGSFCPSVTDVGNGTYNCLFTGILAGSATSITATIGGSLVSSSAPTITVNPGTTASNSQSTINRAAASVNSGSLDLLTLTARDAAGNQLAAGGLTVLFGNTGGTSTGTVCGTVNDVGNGTYTCNFTGVLAGTATSITATIGALSVTSTSPTITVIPGATASLSQSTITRFSATIASGSTDLLTLTTKDAAGNQLASGGLTVAFSNTGGTSTGTSCTTVTDVGNGTYTCNFTGVLAGTATSITATIGGSLVTSPSPTIAVTPGPYSLVQSTIAAGSSTVGVGQSSTLLLTAKDSAGNPLTAGGSTVVFSNSGGTSTGTFCTLVIDNSNGTYSCSFTGTALGTATTIGATIDGGTVSSAGPTITVKGKNLESVVEMLDLGLGFTSTGTTYERTRTSLNTAAYDGTVTYSFEIVAQANFATSVALMDETSTTLVSLAIPNTGAVSTRIRTAFTPTAGNHNYRLATSGTPGSASISVARMIVKQVNATKSRLFIPLSETYSGSNGSDSNGTGNTTSLCSGGYYPIPYSSQWLKNTAAAYSGLDAAGEFTFEAVISTPGGSASAAILDIAVAGGIAASVASTTSAVPVLVSTTFANSAAGFTDTHTFTVGLCSSAGQMVQLYRAGLWVNLSSLGKGEVYHRVGVGYQLPSNYTDNKERVTIDTSLFSTPSVYFEVTGAGGTPTDSGTVGLHDGLVNNSGIAGASVGGSPLTFSGAVTTVRRSAALSITDGDDYYVDLSPTSGSVKMQSEFVVIGFQ